MNAIHYIETSALNLFADELQDFEFNLLYQKAIGIDLCISPIVLYEVLLNTDDSRKESLIYWAQFNCAHYLLKSPSEIVIQYLKAGTPPRDHTLFHQERTTALPIGATWSNIHRQLDQTIPVKIEELKQRAQPLRDLARSYRKIILSMTNESDHSNESDYFHRLMIKLRERLFAQNILTQRSDTITKTSLILGLFVLCIGIDLDNTPIRNYWSDIKIEDPLDRLEFLVESQPTALIRGPLVEMALMMNAQTEIQDGTNRGSVFDALHSIYCYYAHNTVSNDPHFTKLAEHTRNKIYESIIDAETYLEMMKITHKKLTNN